MCTVVANVPSLDSTYNSLAIFLFSGGSAHGLDPWYTLRLTIQILQAISKLDCHP